MDRGLRLPAGEAGAADAGATLGTGDWATAVPAARDAVIARTTPAPRDALIDRWWVMVFDCLPFISRWWPSQARTVLARQWSRPPGPPAIRPTWIGWTATNDPYGNVTASASAMSAASSRPPPPRVSAYPGWLPLACLPRMTTGSTARLLRYPDLP